MGTGILATLSALHRETLPGASAAASVLLVTACLLLAGLTLGFAVHCVRTPGALRQSLRDPAQSPSWGTVSMGVLAVGAATVTVLPLWSGGLSGVALGVDTVLWVLGTVLGLYTALDFATGLAVRELGRPTPVWGLPVVAPMVSATTGCTLCAHLDSPAAQVVLLVVLAGCFGTSLLLGGLVFAVAYHHHWRREPLPLALRPSLWIPLGVVGQSTAAAQGLAQRSGSLLRPEAADAALVVAHWYGVVVLGVCGAAAGTYAVVATVRGALAGMPYTPGWWAMTFPLGTCALGAQQLGQVQHSGAWHVVGVALTCVLVGTWSLCAVATVRALWVRRPDRGRPTGSGRARPRRQEAALAA